MSHSYNKIWIHVVFATKDRFPLIKSGIESKLYAHIREQLIELGCPVRIINGMPEHIHLLFLQNPQKSIAEIVKQIKGNTSHWVNEQNIIPEKFAWQTGYAAYSVSESQMEKVYEYIKSQKKHHQEKTFIQEYDEFISVHGLIKENDS
jgi:putative transposase